MTDVQIMAGTVTASLEDRMVSGLLLPYGEIGRTNIGKFAVEPGAITIPSDLSTVLANLDHAREHAAATAVMITDTPAGLVATFKVAKNEQGDTVLAEIADPTNPRGRRCLSAEFTDVVIKNGKAISGRLFGGAFVERGAFPSASVFAADSPDPEEVDPEADAGATTTEHSETEYVAEDGATYAETTDVTTVTTDSKTTTTTVRVVENKAPEQAEGDTVTTTALASRPPLGKAAVATATPTGPSFATVMANLHKVGTRTADATVLASLRESGTTHGTSVFAALNDVTYDKTAASPGKVINPFPQWVGELWDGLAYVRDIIDLIDGPKPLTANTIAGWRWVNKPEGGDWAGNKSNVPSNTPTAEPYTETTDYFAGAHDHANEYRHFPNPEYWESYYKAMRESYARWSNDKALGYINADAIAVEGDVAPADLAVGLSLLVDGAVSVVENDGVPAWALVEPRLYKGILKTTNNNVMGYLEAALGFESGTLAGSGFKLRAKKGQVGVTVGAREAISFYELPGVPLRIEAEDLTKGGLDTGLFGYVGHVTHKADTLVHVYENGKLPAAE